MKITILALIALVLGIGIGTYTSWREFKEERLPTKLTLAVIAERDTKIPSDGPKVVVDGGEIYDFGTMDRGSSGKHDFVFRNVGNMPLVITMQTTTCKCTAAASGGKKMEKGTSQTIPPGGTFPITLDWVIKQAQPDFSQSAEFRTTDPRREIVRLLIHGRTVDAIELSPASLQIPSATADESVAGIVSILSHRDEELKILSHSLRDTESKDFFTVTFKPLSPAEAGAQAAKGGLTIRVAFKPSLPLRTTTRIITLKTNYEGIEPQMIPVEIQIVGDISLLGPKVSTGSNLVNLGAVEQKAGLTHTVYLHIKGPHREMTELEVESAEPATSLKATLGDAVALSPTVKRIPLKIEIPADAPIGNYLGVSNSQTGRVILKTTHPKIKQLVIPVKFAVQ